MNQDQDDRKSIVSRVRHELRTPINAILGYSEMLLEDLDGDADPALRGDLATMRDGGNRMLERITSALDNITPAGAGFEQELSSTGEALGRELLEILGDVSKRCEAHLGQSAGALDEDLGRIRVAADRLKEIVQRLSAGGFTPAAKPEQQAEEGLEQPTIAAGEQGPSILVVDDSEVNRDLLSRQLQREGYVVTSAANGKQALERLEQAAFDLVLLDIMMPVMNGFEVLERVKRDTWLREIPIIVISAADDMDSAVKCIDQGAEDFLPKPCRSEILRARIRVSLEKKRLRQGEQQSRKQLRAEKRRTESILRAILPHDVVEELKATQVVQPRRYEHVAVLFLDIVDFTKYCDQQPPDLVVENLEQVVEQLEQIATNHRVEKIKTIGDCFMATGGLRLPLENPVLNCVRAGLEMIDAIRRGPQGWNARVGVHAGPVVAGVVGKSKYAFDLWGDTVNTAARVETNGRPGAVNLSGSAWDDVADLCRGESRGLVQVKGKDPIEIISFRGFLE